MRIEAPYLFSAAMSVRPDKEALFNEVYDKEHVPALLAVPGVIAVARFKSEAVTMMIGGELKTIVIESEPAYNALYEIESPSVLVSDAWPRRIFLSTTIVKTNVEPPRLVFHARSHTGGVYEMTSSSPSSPYALTRDKRRNDYGRPMRTMETYPFRMIGISVSPEV